MGLSHTLQYQSMIELRFFHLLPPHDFATAAFDDSKIETQNEVNSKHDEMMRGINGKIEAN